MAQLTHDIPIIGTFEEFVQQPLELLVKARDQAEGVDDSTPFLFQCI